MQKFIEYVPSWAGRKKKSVFSNRSSSKAATLTIDEKTVSVQATWEILIFLGLKMLPQSNEHHHDISKKDNTTAQLQHHRHEEGTTETAAVKQVLDVTGWVVGMDDH